MTRLTLSVSPQCDHPNAFMKAFSSNFFSSLDSVMNVLHRDWFMCHMVCAKMPLPSFLDMLFILFCHLCYKGLLIYSDNIWVTAKLCRTAEALIKGHRNEHSLRACLTPMLATILCYVEPLQSVVEKCSDACISARIVGDIDNLFNCILYEALSPLLITATRAGNLVSGRKSLGNILNQMVCSIHIVLMWSLSFLIIDVGRM